MSTHSQEDALRQTRPGLGESAKFWRESRYGDLECLTAQFRTHVYERHTHETYAIGSIVAGCERFDVRGVEYAARPGDLCFLNPDVVHDGRPEGEGYAYRMIYPSVELLADLASDMMGRMPKGTLTLIGGPIAHNPRLSAAFLTAHRIIEQKNAALETDEAMVQVLGHILKRYGQLGDVEKPVRERRAVGQVKDYLVENVTENVDLATLAAVSGLSRSHLIRAFKHDTGLTPHAFLIDRRVRLARKLLLEGITPVNVAASAGFADQAHMTRAFKARIGITPGSFSRMT